MTARAMRRGAVVLAMLVVAALWLRELQRRADGALRVQAAALASEGGPADVLTAERTSAGAVIHFDRAVAPSGLVSGWSDPEPGLGTWSSGRAATLRLTGLPAGRAGELVLTLRPLVGPGRRAQRVRIAASGRTLAAASLSAPGFQELRVPVPPEAQSPAGTVVLGLELPDAESPARLTPGAQDHRLLAVMLKTVAIPR